MKPQTCRASLASGVSTETDDRTPNANADSIAISSGERWLVPNHRVANLGTEMQHPVWGYENSDMRTVGIGTRPVENKIEVRWATGDRLKPFVDPKLA